MTKTMNPFDFADLSDIMESNPELASKVANSSQDNIDGVVRILQAGATAGVAALSISQLFVAAIRMNVELPAEGTVRKYLNAAIGQGSVVKVTRQTYTVSAPHAQTRGDAVAAVENVAADPATDEEHALVPEPVSNDVETLDDLADL